LRSRAATFEHPVEGKGTEDYVLARDADRLVALYRRAVELDD
jgi:hypothetical protein